MVSRQLAAWRADLIRDLGGEASVSTQQQTLIDFAVRQRLIVESVDAWLFEQATLIDVDKRAVLPVVRERQTIADSLARYLLALGLERKEPEPEEAIEYMRRREWEMAEEEAERARRIAEEDARVVAERHNDTNPDENAPDAA